MSIVLWVLGMLGAFATTAYIYRKTDIGRVVILGPMVYFALYIILSGCLIWIDKFSIERSEILVIVVEVLICVFRAATGKKPVPKVSLNYKKYIPLVVILVGFAFLASNKAELYSTSQDQGLYQEKAMMYMYGNNDNVLSFDEYANITDYNEQVIYMTQLDEMDGIYLRNAAIGTEDCTTEYEIHGVATFAAMLGLWGSMFGLHNMAGVLSVFYLATIAGVWLICDNLHLKKFVSFVTAVLTGICPIVLWCANNILTEIGLAMLVAMFFVFITEEDKRRTGAWSAIAVVAFAFYHITIIYLLPMFLLIYLYLLLNTKGKDMIWALIASLWGYMLGLAMMYSSSPLYMSKNMANVFLLTKGLLTDGNYRKIVFGVCLVATILLILLDRVGLVGKIKNQIKLAHDKGVDVKRARIISIAILLVVVAYHIWLCIRSTRMDLNIIKQCSVGIWLMSGYIILPVALFGVVANARRNVLEPRRMAIIIGLYYFLAIPAGFVFYSINYYYYYARYLAPYIMLVFVAAAMVMDFFKAKYIVPLGVIIAGVLVWQNWILFTEKDLTYGDFEVVESIASCADSKDCVVMIADTNKMCNMLMIPVKATTGADMYFVDYGRFDAQMTELASRYEDVFMLMYDAGFADDGSQPWRYVYQGELHSSIYEIYGGDDIPYPRESVKFDSGLGLFIYTGELVGY